MSFRRPGPPKFQDLMPDQGIGLHAQSPKMAHPCYKMHEQSKALAVLLCTRYERECVMEKRVLGLNLTIQVLSTP